MTLSEIRKKYLEFYKARGHAIIPSASLVPENDPTTLFTGSGMQPMVPYLLGENHPEGTRIADSQKSFRSVDIEEVGDNRHTTFFEMLGNWSLGDYFKKEQLPWIFEFLTEATRNGSEPSLCDGVYRRRKKSNCRGIRNRWRYGSGFLRKRGSMPESRRLSVPRPMAMNVGMKGRRAYFLLRCEEELVEPRGRSREYAGRRTGRAGFGNVL